MTSLGAHRSGVEMASTMTNLAPHLVFSAQATRRARSRTARYGQVRVNANGSGIMPLCREKEGYMDATEPNRDESSPPRSGVEMASEFDDAAIERGVRVMLADGGADVTSAPPGAAREDYARSVVEDILRAAEVVPRADAETLAYAVIMSLDTEVRELAPVRIQAQARLAKALSEYLAKHPWSDLEELRDGEA